MITVKCQECSKEFEAQRTSAKFCSANCRVKFNSRVQTPKEAQQEPETERTVESTQNSVQVVFEEYKPAFVEKKVIDKLVDKHSLTTEQHIEDYQKLLSKQDYVGSIARIEEKPNLQPNQTFDQLLKQFNSLADLSEKPKDIKLKLEQIKESAKNSNLTPRQTDAIVDRCNHFLNNNYNQSKHNLKLS